MVLVVGACFVSNADVFAESLKPVIPLQERLDDRLYWELALRDPGVASSLISDDLYFEQLAGEINQLISETRQTKGVSKEDALKSIYEKFLLMTYFQEDVLMGRVVTGLQKTKIASSLSETRKNVVRYAKAHLEVTKNKSFQASARYHIATQSYLLGSKRDHWLKYLDETRNLNGALLRRSRFLVTAHNVLNKNDEKARTELARISASLTTEGTIAAQLVVARSFGGLNRNGKKAGKTSDKYRASLNAAVNKSRKLSEGEAEVILTNAITVWKRAEGKNQNWSKPPFALNGAKKSNQTLAILERSAIQDYADGNLGPAIKKYKALSKQVDDAALAYTMDQRVVSIHQAQFQKTKEPKGYETVLVEMVGKYNDLFVAKSIDESISGRAKQHFETKYKQFVNGFVVAALKSSASRKERMQAIKIAGRYKDSVSDQAEKDKVDLSIAKIFAVDGQHGEAVAILRDLIQRSQGPEVVTYTQLAIKSQSVVADWPETAPWAGVSTGNAQERTELVTFYEKLNEVNPSWASIAQMGLLKLNLGFKDEAFKLWTASLEKDSANKHAQQAAGYMMISYYDGKQWDELEKFADLNLKNNIKPMRLQKSLNPRTYLGHALFNGGKKHFEEKNFTEAKTKFERFRAEFASDSRMDEATYLLAHCYHEVAEHEKSIETLMVLVQKYPNTKFMRPALLNGGEWSIPMAYEEQAMFFLKRFVVQFPKDKVVENVKDTLIPLLAGRELYGDISRVQYERSESKSLDADARAKAAFELMKLEERFGDKSIAEKAAKKIVSNKNSSASARSQALIFEAKNLYMNNVAKLRQVEQEIASLDLTNADVMESLAEVRFILAQKSAYQVKEEVFNLGLKDPAAELSNQHKAFLASYNSFKKVCETGQNSFCVPALLKISEMTEQAVAVMEELTIPESLDAKSVAAFNTHKEQFLDELAQITQQADGQSVDSVAQGSTTPEWVSRVNWTNNSDWFFNESENETGNSFIQWTTEESHDGAEDDQQ